MRRTDISQSINALREALDSTKMVEALRSMLSSRNEGKKISILPELNAFSILTARFDEATLRLVDIFNLELLADATNWSEMLDPTRIGILHELYNRVNIARDALPRFAELLEQKGATAYRNALPEAQRATKHLDTISVILLEKEKEFSKPERLIELLQSVTELYQGLALMLGEAPDSLTVLSCDSGSDKSGGGKLGVVFQRRHCE